MGKLNGMRAESLEFLKSIVNVPSPSGYEERAAEIYRNYTKAFSHETKTDVHGNVAAIRNPEAKMKVMLAGHMDEIGFVIHHISDDGLLYFVGVGGHDSTVPVGQRVWVHGESRVPGIIGRKAIHLLEDEERKKKPEIKDLWIDIGAASRQDVLNAGIQLGDCVTYQVEFEMLLNGRATARGFDNKMGSFIVAEALRYLVEDGGLDDGVGVYAVATVQEEIGLRGARTSAFWIDPQVGFAVDVNHAIDYPTVSKTRHGVLDIGKGPSVMRGANNNPVLFKLVRQAAEEDKIPFQVDVAPGGTGTDGNAMQISRGGMAVSVMGVPLRYMHTPCELLSLEDVDNCARLMAAAIRRIKPDTDFTPRLER